MLATATAPPTLRARLVNLGSTGVVVGVHALCAFAPFFFSWRVVALAVVSYLLQTLGVTAGYHRYFSHHSFKTGRVFQFILGWLGCAAMQNGPLWWASGHRRHHRFSDREGDPHSPVLGGFWHGHLGWVLSGENDHPDLANVKELAVFPELRFLDRFKWVPTLVTKHRLRSSPSGGPASSGGWASRPRSRSTRRSSSTRPGTSGARGASRRRTRRATTRCSRPSSSARGGNNNHHHDPSSARHGFTWWEIDITYYTIWSLSKLGIVWEVRKPRPWADAVIASKPEPAADTST